MKLRVRPSTIEGEVSSSPSKSYTHRAMALALLAEGTSQLRRPLLSGDTLATLSAVKKFGAGTDREGEVLRIDGGRLRCPDDVINVDNSGTTIRIMAGIASLLPCITVLTGDESIRRRPMQPLIDALGELGAECRSTRGNGLAPLLVRGPNTGTRAHIKGDVSSQFISSLLISSAVKPVDTEIVLTTPLRSRPYVEITMDMMARFGVRSEALPEGFMVPGGQRYTPQDYAVPGDFSSAAFPFMAGALAGHAKVRHLDKQDRQGDKVVLEILSRFGAPVHWVGDSVETSRVPLVGNEVDLSQAPDLFPIVAVMATQAEGVTVIKNAEHVRLKESDRIVATVDFLRRMGAEVEERRDGCVIKGPCPLRGASVDSLADHRILMAAAIATLVAEGESVITDGDCFKISYPGFVEDMTALGADLELIP
jgi:3-phosphoshikimate 1-carboxyvinyltransferase